MVADHRGHPEIRVLLLRADNNGEGGTLSLTALATRALGRRTALVFLLGVVGASMFLGDAVITPAISVLSAVEGLKLVTPAFDHYVVPFTIVVLIALFAAQSRGTARVASFFAPVMVVWFVAIAAAGLLHIRDDPGVIAAINPIYALTFLFYHGDIGLVTLGLVFLVVTGGEALYADLGHFGRKPIRRAWFGLVLPSLLLNYFGQGAKVLADPAAIENPFYRLVPDILLLPMVVLATAATVIASQAVITGAYSLVHQAIQLGLLPRLAILHTSASQAGQIYIPRVTGMLLIGVLLLVGVFRSSEALASAYGIAVATTMVVDGVLAFIVIWKLWHWPLWRTIAVVAPLILVDVVFFSANLLKLFEGAWVPILFGASMVLIILTWRRGTNILAQKTRRSEVPLDTLLGSLEKHPPHTVPGTAVFLTSQPEFAPTALLHNLKHNKVLHDHNVILTIITTDTPRVTGRGAGADHGALAALQPVGAQVRLHGIAECPEGAGHRPQARAGSSTSCRPRSSCRAARSNRRRIPACRAWQDHLFIGLAEVGERRHGLLPDPHRAGGRGRHPGHGVIPPA